ncbi:GNAT family N-acetyltransferase [Bacillaceae bacterium W0354]
MELHYQNATVDDIPFINELCELSWNNSNQWLAYPRVSCYQELITEIEEYRNTLENSVLIIYHNDEHIGFTGFLFEQGDEEAFIIGPVLKKEKHSKCMMESVIQVMQDKSNGLFDKLLLSTSSKNIITNESLKELDWKLTYEQTEMKYDIVGQVNINTSQQISMLDVSNEEMVKQAADLFAKEFRWENAEHTLRHYLENFGMEAAFIEEDGTLLGSVLWHHMDGTHFYRLEDIAVHQHIRGKGIGRDLIHFVINQAAQSNVSTIYLAVDHDNVIARKLYKNIGFTGTIQANTYTLSKIED